ncbi:pentatricopeptide repeat-containing protein At5g66500, mitochondrial-like [Telopea speciosissima]|uniref:pentatricopeptide repeat-containing protein At5g66500, mitochondrial-like n=1 Tax=Telopea speciosissima TaxID=54955 RepID=UPI001CC6E8A2|nr:pentatricopeptide repeat-containing protein At5g66500, mitochondrial-like [Telopea speciosissima]
MLRSHLGCSQGPSLKILISSNSFIRREGIVHANHLFVHRDLFSLNALLSAHVRKGNAQAAWVLFHQMHRMHLNLDAYTFTSILGASSALSNVKGGQQVHALVIKTGSESETVTKTALVDMYSKCGLLSDSVRVFEEAKSKDAIAWNTMISGFLRYGLAWNALEVFGAMWKSGIQFTSFTLCSVLKACASLNALQQGKQVHALVIVMGNDFLVLGTALIDFYSNCGLIGEAMKVFCHLNCRRDNVIFNSLLSGCIRNQKFNEVFMLIRQMKPNCIALTCVLTACSEKSDLSTGKQVHCLAIRLGFELDTQLCNALLDMYAKCGKISVSRALFDRIPYKSVVSWTSIIDAYGSNGHGVEAFELFKEMDEQSSISPNPVTFLAILSACGHCGLVEQGQECFLLMKEKYGIDPGPEHYACFIDLLGRASRIDEAWDLLHDMGERGTEPTREVWAALLNACRTNLDIRRGESAAKQLLELQPEKPGNYILLSNFYSAIGRWDVVEELRGMMRERRLRKEVGSSWITVECCEKNIDCNGSGKKLI